MQHNRSSVRLAVSNTIYLLSPSCVGQRSRHGVAGFPVQGLLRPKSGVGQVSFSSGALCSLLCLFGLLVECSSLWLKDWGSCFLAGCWPRALLVPRGYPQPLDTLSFPIGTHTLRLWTSQRRAQFLLRAQDNLPFDELKVIWLRTLSTSAKSLLSYNIMTRVISFTCTSPTHTQGEGIMQSVDTWGQESWALC